MCAPPVCAPVRPPVCAPPVARRPYARPCARRPCARRPCARAARVRAPVCAAACARPCVSRPCVRRPCVRRRQTFDPMPVCGTAPMATLRVVLISTLRLHWTPSFPTAWCSHCRVRYATMLAQHGIRTRNTAGGRLRFVHPPRVTPRVECEKSKKALPCKVIHSMTSTRRYPLFERSVFISVNDDLSLHQLLSSIENTRTHHFSSNGHAFITGVRHLPHRATRIYGLFCA